MRFNKLIPEISVTKIEESLHFYRDILGFKVEYSRPAEKFYFLSYEDIQIMIEEINNHWWTGELERPFGRGLNFQIEVSDVSVLLKSLDKAKVTLFRPLKESWYKGETLSLVRSSSLFRIRMDIYYGLPKTLGREN